MRWVMALERLEALVDDIAAKRRNLLRHGCGTLLRSAALRCSTAIRVEP